MSMTREQKVGMFRRMGTDKLEGVLIDAKLSEDEDTVALVEHELASRTGESNVKIVGGFTVIEFLIVLVIIGICAATIFPRIERGWNDPTTIREFVPGGQTREWQCTSYSHEYNYINCWQADGSLVQIRGTTQIM
jgi:prepilin-type N-terminal cleavage/methylation domain-containing protein